MKKDTHPEVHPVCFIDVSTGKRFITESTLRSKQKEVIDGIECYVVHCDVTSDSHPAYTGEKRFVDTAGRVEKFNRKFSRSRA
ncbi:MAG: type B 50S ribosomal protein L31 [Puniceicoccales bacterium]|nr:type B 50S ribosomal protein L31 [Puniceicoccales bacterium]